MISTASSALEVDADFSEVIGGVDWGYTNPTAAVVFGVDGDGAPGSSTSSISAAPRWRRRCCPRCST